MTMSMTNTMIVIFVQMIKRFLMLQQLRKVIVNLNHILQFVRTVLFKAMYRKNHTKLIQRHIWEAYVDEAEHLRHHEEIKLVAKSMWQVFFKFMAAKVSIACMDNFLCLNEVK